jgi:DNA-directed RNA polymerase
MRKKIFLILLLFGNLQASLSDVNNLLFSEDINFIHTSTNDSLTKSVVSNGNITRQFELITVNVDEPFREQYIIDNINIKIIDKDFDQESSYEIASLPNNDLISILKNGFKDEDLKELNDKVFKVKNSSQSIILKDITEKSFSIMYLDNLNVLNTITFNKVKK